MTPPTTSSTTSPPITFTYRDGEVKKFTFTTSTNQQIYFKLFFLHTSVAILSFHADSTFTTTTRVPPLVTLTNDKQQVVEPMNDEYFAFSWLGNFSLLYRDQVIWHIFQPKQQTIKFGYHVALQ